MEDNNNKKPLGYTKQKVLVGEKFHETYGVVDAQDYYNASYNYLIGKEELPVKYEYDFTKISVNGAAKKDAENYLNLKKRLEEEASDVYIDNNEKTHYITGGEKNIDEHYQTVDMVNEDEIIAFNEQLASNMVERMANGEDVLGEGQVEENTNNKQMGFAKPWLLGIVTGILLCGIVALVIYLTR